MASCFLRITLKSNYTLSSAGKLPLIHDSKTYTKTYTVTCGPGTDVFRDVRDVSCWMARMARG